MTRTLRYTIGGICYLFGTGLVLGADNYPLLPAFMLQSFMGLGFIVIGYIWIRD